MAKKIDGLAYQVITLLGGIGVLSALIYFGGLGRFWSALREISGYWIAAAAVPHAIAWAFRIYRLKRFTIHAGRDIAVSTLFKFNVSGYALNAVLPARLGDVATVLYLKSRGIEVGRSVAIVLLSGLLDALSLIVCVLPAFILVFKDGAPGWLTTTVFFCIVVVIVPLAVVLLDRNKVFSNLLEALERKFPGKLARMAFVQTKDVYESFHQILSDKRLLVGAIILSLIIAVLQGLTGYAVSVAVGAEVSAVAVILAVSIATLAKIPPITPGGVGVFESVMASVLVLFGVPFETAVVVGILDHGVMKLFNLAIGLPATAQIGFKLTQIRQMAGGRLNGDQ